MVQWAVATRLPSPAGMTYLSAPHAVDDVALLAGEAEAVALVLDGEVYG